MEIIDDDLIIEESTEKEVNNEIKESSYKIKMDEIRKENALKIKERQKKILEIKQQYNIPIKTVKEAKRDLNENNWFIANNNLYQIYTVYRNYSIDGLVKEKEVKLRSIEYFLNYIQRKNSIPPISSVPNQNKVQQQQLSNVTRNAKIENNKGSLTSENTNTERGEPKNKPQLEEVKPVLKQNNQKEEDISISEIIDDEEIIFF